MLDISSVIVLVRVDASDFNLISRSGSVDKVVEHNDFFLSRDSAGWHASWSLLNCELLVVPVNGLLFADRVRSISIAYLANTEFLLDLKHVVAVVGASGIATNTSEVHG